jgi:hypothetical protein
VIQQFEYYLSPTLLARKISYDLWLKRSHALGAFIPSKLIVPDGNDYKHSSGGEQSLRLVRMR